MISTYQIFKMILLLILLLFCCSDNLYAQTFTVNTLDDTLPWDNPDTDEDEADDGNPVDANGNISLRSALLETKGGELFPRTVIVEMAGTISADILFGPFTIFDGFKIQGNNSTSVSGMVFTVIGSDSEISGINILSSPFGGVTVSLGSNIVIKNNVISGNSQSGITIGQMVSNVRVTGNKIGTNISGNSANGNSPAGITVASGATNIIIGGDDESDRNIISGNTIGIMHPGEDVVIKGNYIGTDRSGMFAVPNTQHGIALTGQSNTIFNNVISGNGLYGIIMSHLLNPCTNNKIYGNKIGVTANDTLPLPNLTGINILGNSTNNIIGSSLSQEFEPNIIAYNSANGIFFQESQMGTPNKNSFRKNSFFENGGLAVEISSNLQNGIQKPVLDSLKKNDSGKYILYGNNAPPNSKVDIYYAAADPTGFGEGKEWIKETTSDMDGKFEVELDEVNCNPLTASATDNQGNTSEFSQNLQALPSSKSVSVSCEGPYLEGISFDVTFTVEIDWGGTPDAIRKARFTLNGQNEKEGNLTDNTADVQYNINQASGGSNNLELKLEGCIGTVDLGSIYDFCTAPLPSYLSSPQPSCNGGRVKYTEQVTFPDNITSAPQLSSINDDVPFINGALGIIGVPTLTASVEFPGSITAPSFNSSFSLAGTSFSFGADVSGDLTLDCSGTGGTANANLNASISHTFSYGLSVSQYMPPCGGPPVVKDLCELARSYGNLLTVGATVGGSIDVTVDFDVASLSFTGGSGIGTATLTPFLNVLSFSASGTGSLSLGVSVPSFEIQNLSASVVFNVSESISGWSRQFGPYIHPTFTKPGEIEPLMGREFNRKISIFNWERSASTEELVEENASADVKVITASGNANKKAVVWSDENPNYSKPSADIYVKIFDGTSWKDKINLTGDIQIDRDPQAAFDLNNNLVVVWERNASSSIPDGDEIYSEDFLTKSKIQYAVIDANNGFIISSGSLGEDERYNYKPQLASHEGFIGLMWQSSNAKTFFGNINDKVTLESLKWTGSQWADQKTISNQLKGLIEWNYSLYSNQKAFISMTVDTDDDLSTPHDREIFTAKYDGNNWNEPVRVTNNNRLDMGVHSNYTNDGDEVLTWFDDGEILGLIGDLTQPAQVWFSQDAKITLEFLNGNIIADEDTLLLIWQQAGKIFYSLSPKSQIEWGQPAIFKFNQEPNASFSAAKNNAAKIDLAYTQIKLLEDGVTLTDKSDIYLSTFDLGYIPTSVKGGKITPPDKFNLSQNYPNPFNPSTTISYSLPVACDVTLKVFNTLGEVAATLIDNEWKESGTHNYQFSIINYQLPSGVYFYQLQAGKFRQTRKLVLLK